MVAAATFLLHRDDGSARIFGDVYFLERFEIFFLSCSSVPIFSTRNILPRFPIRDHSKRLFVSDPHLRVVVRVGHKLELVVVRIIAHAGVESPHAFITYIDF